MANTKLKGLDGEALLKANYELELKETKAKASLQQVKQERIEVQLRSQIHDLQNQLEASKDLLPIAQAAMDVFGNDLPHTYNQAKQYLSRFSNQ